MAVTASMDAPRRRLVFGVNVTVQALLVAAVTVFIIWLAGRFNARADLTGTGRNSLSSRTVQLLKNLDQNIRITAVFAEPDKRDELGRRRRGQLRDLLELYEQAGGARVSTLMLDPSLEKAQTDKLLQRLLDLPAYRDEARPHQEALERFAEVNRQLQTLVSEEYKRLEELLPAGDPQLQRSRNLTVVRSNLRQIMQGAQDIVQQVDDLRKSEVPRFGQAVREVREYLSNIEVVLQSAAAWLGGEGLSTPGLTDDLATFFQQAAGRYEPVLKEVRALLDQTKDLQDVKVEEIYNGLTRWRTSPPVLVESEREARVVSFWDIWQAPADRSAPLGPDGEDRVFNGEAAISSAILQLTQKDKTAVVFTRVGGQPLLTPDFSQMNMMMRQLPRAPYGELNQLLEKANFVTAEWDVAASKTPPQVEGAARTVYVIFPPEPPQSDMRQFTPPSALSPEDRKLILDAVAASGKAVFLVGWRPPPMPFPGAGSSYEFGDYLKSNWGVEVLQDSVTLRFMPHPEKVGQEWVPVPRQPQLITTDDVVRLAEHAIGGPLKNDRAGFPLTVPLRIAPAESRPAGVQVEVVAEVTATTDAWACGDLAALEEQLKRRQGVRPGASDVRAPFPIAVAAANAEGHKVVVFGSEHFASDAIAQATGIHQVGNALLLGLLYPANTDLFINALHWLTGEADRIAVGPRRGEFPRLRDLDEATAARLPYLLVGLWPAVALGIGVGVWIVRRR